MVLLITLVNFLSNSVNHFASILKLEYNNSLTNTVAGMVEMAFISTFLNRPRFKIDLMNRGLSGRSSGSMPPRQTNLNGARLPRNND
jgi:hypothetical protein